MAKRKKLDTTFNLDCMEEVNDENNDVVSEKENSVRGFSDLPEEIVLRIFSSCTGSINDRLIIGNVCQKWLRILKDSSLWERYTACFGEDDFTATVKTNFLSLFKSVELKLSSGNVLLLDTIEECVGLIRLVITTHKRLVFSANRLNWENDDLYQNHDLEVVTNRSFRSFADALPNLKAIQFCRTTLTNDDFEYFFSKHLDLRALGCINAYSMPAPSLRSLGNMKNLQYLRIFNLSDSASSSIVDVLGSGFPNLKTLILDSWENFFDDQLALIAVGCPNLEFFSASGWLNFGVVGIRALFASCRRLMIVSFLGADFMLDHVSLPAEWTTQMENLKYVLCDNRNTMIDLGFFGIVKVSSNVKLCTLSSYYWDALLEMPSVREIETNTCDYSRIFETLKKHGKVQESCV